MWSPSLSVKDSRRVGWRDAGSARVGTRSRQRESERILRDQLEQLRQELERTRYEMKEERARLIHELEVQQKESREQYLVVQEKLNELLAAKAQQSKGKDNE